MFPLHVGKKRKKSKRATTGKTETEMLNETEIKHHVVQRNRESAHDGLPRIDPSRS